MCDKALKSDAMLTLTLKEDLTLIQQDACL